MQFYYMKLIILIFILIVLSILINFSLLLLLWIYIKNKCQKCMLVSKRPILGGDNLSQSQDQKLKEFILQITKENLSTRL